MITLIINGKKQEREFQNMAQALAFAYQSGECHSAKTVVLTSKNAKNKNSKRRTDSRDTGADDTGADDAAATVENQTDSPETDGSDSTITGKDDAAATVEKKETENA